MDKEQKCISLPLAKELQKVADRTGFKLPKSEYYWVKAYSYEVGKEFTWVLVAKEEKSNRCECLPALDTSELGEILKNCDHPVPYWCSQANVKSWCSFKNGEAFDICEKNEAEARGKIFIYLIKNKLITKTNDFQRIHRKRIE